MERNDKALGYKWHPTLAPTSDRAISSLESRIEDGLIWTFAEFRMKEFVSKDANVHVFRPSLTTGLARLVILSFVTLLLLIPIAIYNALSGAVARLVILLLATGAFFSALTKPKTIELFLARTT
ncbi:MAG: hypothetical protein LQ344_003488 [Seirophora lacunosa]|nr:MAG: hypothetical protein LQ344_003488 [Seirophora lacunosa]